ncbi:MAG: TIGR04086 family membrane protein [Clostridia bacterium]|nr:TIGR04086 family membrane protein [Clostridia bacterium]
MSTHIKGVINILRGALFGIILTIIMFLLLAFIINISQMNETVISPAVQIIKVVSLALTGIYAARISGSKGWLTGALAGILYIIISLIICHLLKYIDLFSRPLYIELIFGAVIGAIGGIIGVNIRSGIK